MTIDEYAAKIAKLTNRDLRKKITHLRRTYRRPLPNSTLVRIGSYLAIALDEQRTRNDTGAHP